MTTPPNAPDVLPLPKWHEELVGMMPGKGLYEHQQEWVKYEDASAAVTALLTREAALVARNADLEQGLASACHAGRGLSSICTEYRKQLEAMTAERDALAAEVGALTSARDAYRTMLWQAEEDVNALREHLADLRQSATEMCDATGGDRCRCRDNLRNTLASTSAARAEAGHG